LADGRCLRLATAIAAPATQIHTHTCATVSLRTVWTLLTAHDVNSRSRKCSQDDATRLGNSSEKLVTRRAWDLECTITMSVVHPSRDVHQEEVFISWTRKSWSPTRTGLKTRTCPRRLQLSKHGCCNQELVCKGID
jgi:hypothetical protein